MLKDVLTSYAPKGLDILKQAIQKVTVTGRTLNSLRFVVDTLNLKLIYYGRGFMQALEHGRGPRKNSTYDEFDSHLDEWLRAKGFAQKKTKTGKVYYQIGGQWYSAKSLAWKINKKGDRQFRSGGVKEVYSKEMEGFKEDLTKAIIQDQKQEFKNKILTSLK